MTGSQTAQNLFPMPIHSILKEEQLAPEQPSDISNWAQHISLPEQPVSMSPQIQPVILLIKPFNCFKVSSQLNHIL